VGFSIEDFNLPFRFTERRVYFITSSATVQWQTESDRKDGDSLDMIQASTALCFRTAGEQGGSVGNSHLGRLHLISSLIEKSTRALSLIAPGTLI
jgi:hypothetical protein